MASFILLNRPPSVRLAQPMGPVLRISPSYGVLPDLCALPECWLCLGLLHFAIRLSTPSSHAPHLRATRFSCPSPARGLRCRIRTIVPLLWCVDLLRTFRALSTPAPLLVAGSRFLSCPALPSFMLDHSGATSIDPFSPPPLLYLFCFCYSLHFARARPRVSFSG